MVGSHRTPNLAVMVLSFVLALSLAAEAWQADQGSQGDPSVTVIQPLDDNEVTADESEGSAGSAPVAPGYSLSSLQEDPDVPAAAPAGSAAAGSVGNVIPYVGKVTGNDVYIRSGPAQVYYDVGKLFSGQLVVVREERKGISNWARIDPSPQCYSWISRQFVEIVGEKTGSPALPAPEDESPPEPAGAQDTTVAQPAAVPPAAAEAAAEKPGAANPAEPGEMSLDTPAPSGDSASPTGPWTASIGKRVLIGKVTGNFIRVRAGSIKVPPANANQVQVKLNKGATVEIIGQRDDYYKIVCPKGSYFWASLDYIERVGPVTPENLAKVQAQPLADAGQAPDTARADAGPYAKERQEYIAIVQAMAAERGKPLDQQDFSGVRTNLTKLIQGAQSLSIKASAQTLERQLVRCETAVDLWKMSKRQDERLAATLDKIDEELELLVAVKSPVGKTAEEITVQGRLAESAVFTAPNKNRRFLVLNDKERIIYYAVTARDTLDLNAWLNKRVSLVGTAEYDAFSRIRVLKVTNVVELPPGM
ncbi:MAG: hypothetical protein JW810_04410 [Sedimentisphaerales bacterium]|nr:hypothetical protein [Sedimentisphaerales bacterium]